MKGLHLERLLENGWLLSDFQNVHGALSKQYFNEQAVPGIGNI